MKVLLFYYYYYLGTNTHGYPYQKDNPTGPLRSEKSYDNDINLRNMKNGFLGRCCLNYLEFFHPVSSTSIDYMHSLLEGFIKSMFYRWFDQCCGLISHRI